MSIASELTRLQTAKADLKAWANDALTTIDEEALDAYPTILETATDELEDELDALNGTDTVTPTVGGFTGHVDAVGLAEIGWNEADIAYYQERVWWNEEDDDLWAVSDAEKSDYAAFLAGGDVQYLPYWRWLPKLDYNEFASDPGVMSVAFYEACPYLVGVPQTWNGDTQITILYILTTLPFIPVFDNLSLLGLIVGVCAYLTELSGFDTSGCIYIAIAGNPMLRSIVGVDASLAIAVDNVSDGLVINTLPNLMRCEIANIGESIDLSGSLFLSHHSMVYMMNHAQTVTDKTMTFGTYNLSKLTDDEIAVATEKGWTVA